MAPMDGTGDASRGSNASSEPTLPPGKVPESTTILIVGGGPVGIASAVAFARYGLDCVILERHATRTEQPKANIVNNRSVEIFRQYSLDLEPLRKLGLSEEEDKTVVFASSMTGLEFGQIEVGPRGPAARYASPEAMMNVPQPLLEQHLLRTAMETGKVTYLRMHEWQHCDEDPTTKEITSTVLLRETNVTRQITSKYLIACDGTNARSRDVLQIPFETPGGAPETVLHYVSVHFSADLSQFKPAMLWFILNSTGMGIFITYNRKNSWVFTTPYDPSVTPPATFTSEFLKAQVLRNIGAAVDDYKEIGITLFKTSPKVAASYRSKKVSHAFLAGDAAHSFPPTSGLGVNTGIADIHNLAWKIYAVDKGWTSDAFLDTVTHERWPVANDNTKQSKLNEDKIHSLVSAIFKSGMTEEELWADECSRKEIQIAVNRQYDHFDSLNLVLGYVYGRDHVRGPSDYQKENVPGARLPHEWVENGAGERVSTLDLVDGFGFVLFNSSGLTTEQEIEIQGLPISVVQLKRDLIDHSGEWTRLLGLTQEAAVLVRPDQHIVGSVASMEKVPDLLADYWNSNNNVL